MKFKNIYLFITLSILVIAIQSCNEESDKYNLSLSKTESQLNIISPNGEKIAEDILSLKNLISAAAELKYKEYKEIELTDIVYYEAELGFIAEIEYITYDGYKNNVFICSDENTINSGNLSMNFIRTKSGSENEVTSGRTVYWCENSDRDTCPDCSVSVEIDPQGKRTPRCSCAKGDRRVCEVKQKEI